MRLQKEQKSRGPAKRKHFQITLHKKHQSRVQEQMVTDCETSLSFLGLHYFVGTKIEIFNENTHEYETLNLVDEEHIQTSSQTEELTNENIDEVNLPLYIKERFDVSNEAYHKLQMSSTITIPTSVTCMENVKIASLGQNHFFRSVLNSHLLLQLIYFKLFYFCYI